MIEQEAVVVGAGPSGIGTAACLKTLSTPHIVLEREDCFASIWKKYAYDRLSLHLPKRVCELPHVHLPADYPEYVPKDQFVRYLDDYVARFGIEPAYGRSVESAAYDEGEGKWRVSARVVGSGEVEVYLCRFLVVATGESSDAFIPEVEGIEGFGGKVIHSTGYKNGKEFANSRVLVVGSGNSGMEIALDLANHGARTSIVVRSPVKVSLAFSLCFKTKYEVYLLLIPPNTKKVSPKAPSAPADGPSPSSAIFLVHFETHDVVTYDECPHP